ncbi:MAG: TRAP transporter small permease [Pelagibacteraceae bacterium]|nr:TRAP transporter small permease [Pelagibacteraceae bacterium]MDC0947455.1 TRAP transporter small permease [Candidatus Pelagibacter sp.]|tara:strand:- start:334 stop:825 length:492 start_codon:yes stop_codon:yes gene_type:complete
MINKLNNILKSIYNYSGYLAATFLVFVALFILIGIISRIFGFYVRGLAEYSGYCMAASSFFALAYTFYNEAHIRITLFLEKLENKKRRIAELWCLSIASFFSGFMAFYFIKMTLISIKFEERSEGADEIFIWIPQTSVAIGSLIFFICVFHHLIFSIIGKKIS